jgi:hypothetical protein
MGDCWWSATRQKQWWQRQFINILFLLNFCLWTSCNKQINQSTFKLFIIFHVRKSQVIYILMKTIEFIFCGKSNTHFLLRTGHKLVFGKCYTPCMLNKTYCSSSRWGTSCYGWLLMICYKTNQLLNFLLYSMLENLKWSIF